MAYKIGSFRVGTQHLRKFSNFHTSSCVKSGLTFSCRGPLEFKLFSLNIYASSNHYRQRIAVVTIYNFHSRINIYQQLNNNPKLLLEEFSIINVIL